MREAALQALTKVVGVVEKRQTLPILGNVLLRGEGDSVTMVGTDMEMEIRAACPAEVAEEGTVTVPARKIADIVRCLSEGSVVRLKVSGERCALTAGKGRYVLGTLPGSDFPTMDAMEVEASFEVEEGVLKRVLEKTAFAMAQQDVRYYLNGLLLEMDGGVVRSVATDGHRLARYEQAWETGLTEPRAVIVPGKAVGELRRQLGGGSELVRIEVGQRQICFRYGGGLASSKLVDGRYPDYGRVIPGSLRKAAVVDREGLKKALTRAAILSNERFRGLRLCFESGVLRLVAQNPEQEEAVEEIDAKYDGEETAIGFNVSYLSDLLGAVDRAEVEVLFEDGNSSSVWRGLGAVGETYVVMPMRL